MYGVAELKQIFGEIGAVLPGDAGEKGNVPLRILNSHIHSNKAPILPQKQFNAETRSTHCAGRPPLDPMYGVAEPEEILGEIGAVLPGDAGEKGNAPFRILNSHIHSNKAPVLPQKQFNADKPQCIALDRPVTLGPVGAGRIAQTPIMTLFLQANEPGRRFSGLIGRGLAG